MGSADKQTTTRARDWPLPAMRGLARLADQLLLGRTIRVDSFRSLRSLPWAPLQLRFSSSSATTRDAPLVPSQPPSGSSSSGSSGSSGSGGSTSSSSGSGAAAEGAGSAGGAGAPSGGSGVLAFLAAKKAEFRDLFQRYGWFTGFTYFGVYLVTLGGVYASVRAGLLPAPDVNAVLNEFSAKKALLGPEPLNIPPQWRDFATAWIYTKTTEPLRLVATIVIVPVLARQLPPHVLAALGVRAASAAAASAVKQGVK
jgi:hypothetical protein